MKKLVLMFAAVAAISFASCTPKAADADAAATDSIAVTDSVTVEVTMDSIPGDSVN